MQVNRYPYHGIFYKNKDRLPTELMLSDVQVIQTPSRVCTHHTHDKTCKRDKERETPTEAQDVQASWKKYLLLAEATWGIATAEDQRITTVYRQTHEDLQKRRWTKQKKKKEEKTKRELLVGRLLSLRRDRAVRKNNLAPYGLVYLCLFFIKFFQFQFNFIQIHKSQILLCLASLLEKRKDTSSIFVFFRGAFVLTVC